jgi:polysaccharide pyruvyl transferase WcaK-like protein
VIRAIRDHLRSSLPEAVFLPKACAHNRGWGAPYRLTGRNIEFSNRFADAVIVGGSDLYNNWSLRSTKKEIITLVPPLFLIGLGVTSKGLGRPPHIEKSSYLVDIRVTNETAKMSSVRDRYTQHFLEDLGFSGSVLTGCPSMYLFDERFHLMEDGLVAVTFPFPVARRNAPRTYETLVGLIERIHEVVHAEGLDIVVVCHDDRDVLAAQDLFPGKRLFFSNYVDEVFEFYHKAALVIGSRLHASILAAGMGKPFVNINVDARGKGFSETFGLDNWNVDITSPTLAADVEARIRLILGRELEVFHRFHEVKSRYKQVFLTFMRDVAATIRASLPHSRS